MAIGPKGPPQKPGLSIRGRVIFDTVRGVPRVRPWPPSKPTKPGSKRNLTAKAFGAANRACKVTASVFYGEHWQATRGTPLLPRDLMIAMMYGRAFALQLEDGRKVFSMAARKDVSDSLDAIGQTPGSTLVRGEQYWEAGAPPSAGSWELAIDEAIPNPSDYIAVAVSPHGTDIICIGKDVTTSGTTGRNFQVSTDGGSTWWDGASDYLQWGSDGQPVGLWTMPTLTQNNAGPRMTMLIGFALAAEGAPKVFLTPQYQSGFWIFQGSTEPITNVRMHPGPGNTLTGGQFTAWRK